MNKTQNTSTKLCPKDKIVNPATGRCVKISGKIGQALMMQFDKKTKDNRTTPKKEIKAATVSKFVETLRQCIKENKEIEIKGIVPFSEIAKFNKFRKSPVRENLRYAESKPEYAILYTHRFTFDLVKNTNGIWNISIYHHSYCCGRSGDSQTIVFLEDIVKKHILDKPDITQQSIMTAIFETLCVAIIRNDSNAPLSVYTAIGHFEPNPTVYKGFEGKGFRIGNNETIGMKASMHVIDGELAQSVSGGKKYKSTALNKEAKKSAWRVGDVIGIASEIGYRNHGKYFWDGKKIIFMETEYDDYGSVPNAFPITGNANGFDAHSWSNVVDNNAIVPVNFGVQIGAEIEQYYKNKGEYDYIVFTIDDVNWAICGHREGFNPLIKGKGFLSAAFNTKLVNAIIAKYNIPIRQILKHL